MRVVQLITQARGGPVDHAVEVAAELARLGHESHLVGPAGAHEAALANAGVHVHTAAMETKSDALGARRVARTVRRLRPDVVHAQDRRAGLVTRTLLRGTPGVYTLHGVPDPLAGLVPGNLPLRRPTRRDRIANLSAERLLATAGRSRVVVPCAALADYAREHVGVAPDSVRVVHNGVGQRWLGEATEGHQHSGHNSGAGEPITVAWLGVMQPVKRVPDLVAAVAATPGVRLLLVGDGPERPAVERVIAAAGIADRVHLAGFRSDPLPLLRTADVLALPSAAEACPMALLQAMACGIPGLASRAGGIPEIVRDGLDGLLFETGDDAALRQALRLLVASPDLRERLGDSARERVHARFTIGHCTRNLLDVYEEVAR